jgi:outer membrane protein
MFIKKFVFLILFFNFFSFSYAVEKVAYIDMDFILSESKASKSLFNQLKKIETTQLENLKKKEKILKDNENKILSSKNILSNEEYVKKVKIFNKDLTNYQSKKKEIIRSFNSKQNNEIMRFIKLISPLINEYMDKNSISILIEKKNIFIAKSNYDITKNILEIINNEVKEFKILND